MSTGKRIKHIRKEILHLSQEEFAKKIGYNSKAAVSGIENDEFEPNKDALKKIAEVAGVSVDYLLNEIGDITEQHFAAKERSDPYTARESVPVPLLGKIPAGFPESYTEALTKQWVYLPDAPKGSYALIVKGDSMSPAVRDGDYILFKPDGHYADGSIVVASNDYGDPTLKRYRKVGAEEMLLSDNPEYHKIDSSMVWHVKGVVIKVWREIKF